MLAEIDVFGLSIKTFGLFFGLNFVLVGLIAARRLKELGKPVDWAYEMTFAALVGGRSDVPDDVRIDGDQELGTQIVDVLGFMP